MTRLSIRIFLCALVPLLAWGQDFDRLTIRPTHDDDTESYVTGRAGWPEADGWPKSDPETVSLRAPESGVTGHTMTMPPRAPPEKYCLMVNETGQWFFERCRFSTHAARAGQVTLLDQTDDNESCSRERVVSSSGVGIRPHWRELECAQNENFTVKFRVPPGLKSAPDLVFWGYNSSSFGAATYQVRRSCRQPDDGDVWGDSWDATYTPSHTFGASGRLSKITFTQTAWTPAADQLCLFNIQQTSGASVTSFLIGQIE